MNKFTRVNLIKDISWELKQKETPSSLLMVIREYGIGIPGFVEDEWQQLELVLGQADDDTLIGLAKYCAVEPTEDIKPSSHGSYEQWVKGVRLFISHSSENRDEITALVKQLNALSVATFIAHKDIVPPAKWNEQLIAAISSCNILVAYITPAFLSSEWTDQEVGIAIGFDKPIIPISFEQELRGFIKTYQAVYFKPKSDVRGVAWSIAEKIIRSVEFVEYKREILLRLFETSSSYSEARKNVSLLEANIGLLSLADINRLDKALSGNSQNSGVYDVPGRIEQLIKGIKVKLK